VADTARREEFADFVHANFSSLMTIAVAVSGSRVEAEDLVQTALTNAYPRWHKIRPDQALAYLRRSIVNAHVSRWRRHRGAEFSVAEPPEGFSPASTHGVDDRLTLVPLVRALPPRQRAVIVLRYLCDLGDREIAQTLGISEGTVRSQAKRALATLRATRAEPQLVTVPPIPEEER
jgi:RNA polymerase sigma-70 factor (sigma-E family)